jgi:hypothetical protein
MEDVLCRRENEISRIQTNDGGYAVAGYIIEPYYGWSCMDVVNLDSSGTLQWSTIMRSPIYPREIAYSIAQIADGGYVVAGYSDYYWDMYIVKLNPSGTVEWSKTVGGADGDEARSIVRTNDGGVVVTGISRSFGAGGYDMYIVKFDSSGSTCGNSVSRAGYSGTFGTVGTSSPAETSPTPTVTNPTPTVGDGGTIATICVTRVQSISNEIPNSFELYQNYPNPFNSSTTISFQLPVSDYVQLAVYDMLGKEISELVNERVNPGTYEVEWNATNYPNGVYLYKLTAGDYTQTKKMVLAK